MYYALNSFIIAIFYKILRKKIQGDYFLIFPYSLSKNTLYLKILAKILTDILDVDIYSHLFCYREPYWYIHNYMSYGKITFYNLTENTETWPSQSIKEYSYIITYIVNRKLKTFNCYYEKDTSVLPFNF